VPIVSLTLLKPYASRIGRTRWTVKFAPGVNVLVGPNGSGKSTILEAIRKEILTKEKKDEYGHKLKDQKRHATHVFEGKPMEVFAFDFEKQNPRVDKGNGWLESIEDIRKMSMRWKYASTSHGECTKDILKELDAKLTKAKDPCFVMMDEPEQALDLNGMRELHRILSGHTVQAVVATHHPFLMADRGFHAIETWPHYREEVMEALLEVADQWRQL
jgi:predicted ATPase